MNRNGKKLHKRTDVIRVLAITHQLARPQERWLSADDIDPGQLVREILGAEMTPCEYANVLRDRWLQEPRLAMSLTILPSRRPWNVRPDFLLMLPTNDCLGQTIAYYCAVVVSGLDLTTGRTVSMCDEREVLVRYWQLGGLFPEGDELNGLRIIDQENPFGPCALGLPTRKPVS